MKIKTKVRAGFVDSINHGAVKVKTTVRAGGLKTVNGLTTVNHSAVKVKTNTRAGATPNGMRTVNG